MMDPAGYTTNSFRSVRPDVHPSRVSLLGSRERDVTMKKKK
jgi:hypothetical protein